MTAQRPATEADIMRRLSADNPKSREHHEEYADGRSFWRCIPIRDAVEVRQAAIEADARRPALDVEREPCGYCGSRNGETPDTAYSQDPIDGTMLRSAIAEACSLTNPRLSEVDWDAVPAFLPMVEVCPHPEGAMTSTAEVILCTRCGRRWSNVPLAALDDAQEDGS